MQNWYFFRQRINSETPDMDVNQAILNHPVVIYSKECDTTLKDLGDTTILNLDLKRMNLNLDYPVDQKLKKFCKKFFKSLNELNKLLKDRSKVYAVKYDGGQNESGNQQSI